MRACVCVYAHSDLNIKSLYIKQASKLGGFYYTPHNNSRIYLSGNHCSSSRSLSLFLGWRPKQVWLACWHNRDPSIYSLSVLQTNINFFFSSFRQNNVPNNLDFSICLSLDLYLEKQISNFCLFEFRQVHFFADKALPVLYDISSNKHT